MDEQHVKNGAVASCKIGCFSKPVFESRNGRNCCQVKDWEVHTCRSPMGEVVIYATISDSDTNAALYFGKFS